ncbi:MAG: conserved putative rane protein [Chlamydiales bacterium]|nr:conserved putative rane protein [Chlamydiales bacterium]
MIFFVILLYALFASVFTISKAALAYADPFFLVGSRMMLAGLLLLAYLFLFQRQSLVYHKGSLKKLVLTGVFNIYLTNALEFWGLQYLTSFKTCFIYSLSPFLSALFSYFMLQETLTWKKAAGLAIGFFGFLPMLLSEGGEESSVAHIFFFSLAEIAVIGAAISTVIGWIFLRQLVNDFNYSPLMANGVSMLIGGIFSLIQSIIVEDWHPLPVSDFWPFLKLALLLIAISNLTCYNLYGWLLKHFTATFMSFAGFTTSFFTAFFSWVYLGERPTALFFVSSAFVSLGLFLYYQEELKRGVRTSSLPSAPAA